MNNEAITEVRDAKMRYENAKKANLGIEKRRTEYSNVLLNYAEDLLAAADECQKMEEEYGLLVQENMRLQQELHQRQEADSAGKTAKAARAKE